MYEPSSRFEMKCICALQITYMDKYIILRCFEILLRKPKLNIHTQMYNVVLSSVVQFLEIESQKMAKNKNKNVVML